MSLMYSLMLSALRINCRRPLLGILFACLPITTMAEQKQDLEHLVVTNDPAYFVSQEVGIKGLPEFNAQHKYTIVVTPTLDPKSATGVRIPKDIKEAVAELLVALPDSYRKALHFKVDHDQHNEPLLDCSTDNDKVDSLIIDWMVVYWNLRDRKSPLMNFYHMHISDGSPPEAMLFNLGDYLCRALYAERYKD